MVVGASAAVLLLETRECRTLSPPELMVAASETLLLFEVVALLLLLEETAAAVVNRSGWRQISVSNVNASWILSERNVMSHE